MVARARQADARLAQSFLDAFAAPRADATLHVPSLEKVLSESVHAARIVWPALEISDEAFARFVAERAPNAEDLLQALRAMRVDDLFLVCACVERVHSAQERFQAHYFDEVDFAWRKLQPNRSRASFRDEVRARLFEGDSPRIARYTGRCALRTWLQAVIAGIALEVERGARPGEIEDDLLTDLALSGEGPELATFKERHREALKAAFADALSRLSSREKNLLRYALADRLSLAEIGRVYGVRGLTAARWLQSARAAFAAHVRATLAARFDGHAELDEVLKLALAQIDVTLARTFAARSSSRLLVAAVARPHA